MQIEIGSVFEGKVSGITKFGAFVTFDGDKTGMVHISEISDGFVKEIRDVISENQLVRVKVISVGDDGKIGLSIKQASEKKKKPQKKRRNANVWQGVEKEEKTEDMSFEDMLSRFKRVSDEKIVDLKRSKESKHSAGFSRSGNKKY